VNQAKIGSVGISIKKGISFHGLALNVTADLTPFTWINPCGLSGVAMTSIEKELPETGQKGLAMAEIKDAMAAHFSQIFDFSITRDQ